MSGRTINWTTPKGSQVSLAIETSKTVNADGMQVQVPCYWLRLTVPGEIVDWPEYRETANGPVVISCSLDSRTGASIPADRAAEVKAMVAEAWAHREAKESQQDQVDREHQQHSARMRRAMEE